MKTALMILMMLALSGAGSIAEARGHRRHHHHKHHHRSCGHVVRYHKHYGGDLYRYYGYRAPGCHYWGPRYYYGYPGTVFSFRFGR